MILLFIDPHIYITKSYIFDVISLNKQTNKKEKALTSTNIKSGLNVLNYSPRLKLLFKSVKWSC